jgi:D-galactarolactone cycloisomerase
MKITRLEPILVALPYEHGGPKTAQWPTMDTLLVRVETEDGITGWGEAFGFAASPVTASALSRLVAPLALGRDAADGPALMADLRRRLQNLGNNGPVSFALSGLDIALWDIRGKIEGRPLYALLGGSARYDVPVYASLLRYGTAALVERNAAEAIARGYRRIKLHEITVDTVAAARAVCGADLPIMVDTNCAWNFDDALAMARRLRPYGLWWLEEPIAPPNDFDALARLRREAGMAIAAGENLGSLAEAQFMLEKDAVDIIQPSVTKIGGVSELMKVIALARSRGITVAPHSPYFGPGLIASVHAIAAAGGDMYCERFYCDLDASPLGDAVDAHDGRMLVPQGPGLGIAIDDGVIARYRVA